MIIFKYKCFSSTPKYLMEMDLPSLSLNQFPRYVAYCTKVGLSKPPLVLTSGFNRLKQPWSICQKVVNTGQYESEWSIENSKGRFCGGLRILYRFYVLSTEKRKKNCFVPTEGTFHGEISISRP